MSRTGHHAFAVLATSLIAGSTANLYAATYSDDEPFQKLASVVPTTLPAASVTVAV